MKKKGMHLYPVLNSCLILLSLRTSSPELQPSRKNEKTEILKQEAKKVPQRKENKQINTKDRCE